MEVLSIATLWVRWGSHDTDSPEQAPDGRAMREEGHTEHLIGLCLLLMPGHA